jgi:hypothetical protein
MYRDAIEYTGQKPELKGYGFFIGAFFGCLGFALGLFGVFTYFSIIAAAPVSFFWIVGNAFALTMLAVVLAVSVWAFFFGLRMDLFHALDLPIIFDRKRRKVYRVLQEIPPGILNVFKPWPPRVCEYDWDLIDAEHQAHVMTTGGTIERQHSLVFLVRKSASDPTLIDFFQIGNAMDSGPNTVPGMWEHIRRFMEDGGPHLPSDDEPLSELSPPSSWWQSLGSVGFIGPGYGQRWAEQPLYMLFMHAGFFITIPMAVFTATGRWLGYKTAWQVQWPQEVQQAVGPALRKGAGW